MTYRTRTQDQLERRLPAPTAKRTLLGFDGFVDTIVTPVGLRRSHGDDFDPIRTITEFGSRILGAAGKSSNLEFYPRMDKLGGNGPIMANALLATGNQVTYVGALGIPAPHAVFSEFAGKATLHSLCAPGHTTAVEFEDGKLMLGQTRSLDEITYERICEVMGAESFARELEAADLIGLVNWTMIPGMSRLFEDLLATVLPRLGQKERRFFFDLADPEKRTVADLRGVLGLISRFETFGRVTLGLNLKEAQQVYACLDFPNVGEEPEELKRMAADLRKRLGVDTVVIHPKESAACATAEGAWWIPGPYATKPLITTGAGDHFNAGFSNGQLLGFNPEECLCLGVCTSGHYVRTAESPSLEQLRQFLINWKE